MRKLTLIVDRPDVLVAEYDASEGQDEAIQLDDVGLARLLAAWEIAHHAGQAAGELMSVEVRQRPAYRSADPTPADLAEIDEECDRIRLTLGDQAAEDHRAERLAGGL